MKKRIGRFYVDMIALHPEVTGSCILCVVRVPNSEKRIKFIVDCGLFQEREYSEYNKELLFNADDLDFACVTHAHVDHIGRLPFLLANGFKGRIYCSDKTGELLPYSLYDSCRVLRETAKRNHVRPLYSEHDVENTLSTVNGCLFGKTTQVNEFVKVTFLENGHLYGAALILVQIESNGESINLLFTGDYSPKNVFFDVAPLPMWVKELHLNIITESTYGSMAASDFPPCFEQNILDAVAAGKDVVIPAFSLGRGQEMLLLLKRLQEEGRLSTGVVIYYCGKLGIRYTREIFMNNFLFREETRQFLPQNMVWVDKSNKEQMYFDSAQKIIVGSSGMATYGPMQTIIPLYIQRNALIHFTGYCAEGTFGRKLIDTQMNEAVELSGMFVKKKAEIKSTNEFSAHARSDELISFLEQFPYLKTVLINHGSVQSKAAFSAKVLDEISCGNVAVLSRETGFRISPSGLHQPLNSKFF